MTVGMVAYQMSFFSNSLKNLWMFFHLMSYTKENCLSFIALEQIQKSRCKFGRAIIKSEHYLLDLSIL